ncbi:hypothetical protein GCM10023085_53830 [Actinomadura viridis]
MAGPALRVRLPPDKQVAIPGQRDGCTAAEYSNTSRHKVGRLRHWSGREAELSGHAWREHVSRRGTAEQDRGALARLIEHDADPFEVELYELAADPQTLLIDRAQRRRAGQHERHVKRLKSRGQHPRA